MTTASAGNQALTGYLRDGGTSGAGVDRISIKVGTGTQFNMTGTVTDAVYLTGGNLWVPKPSTK